MASAGYPECSSKGDVIVGTETLADEADVDVIHAGTAERDGALVTAGGRVLAVTAVGTDVADARAKAYEGISSISFPGAQWRTDIAAEWFETLDGRRELLNHRNGAPHDRPQRPRHPLRRRGPRRRSGRRSTRSCSSGGCGSPC